MRKFNGDQKYSASLSKLIPTVLIALGLSMIPVRAQGVYGPVSPTQLKEIQLAGIRLGSLAIERDENGTLKKTCLLSVWGMPDFIAAGGTGNIGESPGSGAGGGMPGAIPGVPFQMPEGMPGGRNPGFGRAPMSSGDGQIVNRFNSGSVTMQPFVSRSSARRARGQAATGNNYPGVVPVQFGGMAEMGTAMGMAAGMGGMSTGIMPSADVPFGPGMGMMGGPAQAMPGGSGGSGRGSGSGLPAMPAVGLGGGEGAAEELAWAQAASMFLRPNQMEWLYRVPGHLSDPEPGDFFDDEDVTIGFIIDSDGVVIGIVVVGLKSDFIRTAMGRFNKTIKLGDSMQRVMLRYGMPDVLTVTSPHKVGPNSVGRDFSVSYLRTSNILFTVQNYKVVRIFIFVPERVTP